MPLDMFDTFDRAAFSLALSRAQGMQGRTCPNPAVGATLAVREIGCDRIVAAAATAVGGRPHAETQALAAWDEQTKDDSGTGTLTLYVTLEPCAHQGKTGPCTDAIIAAGVKRVVTGPQDPDARVAGRGFARLRAAGVEVLPITDHDLQQEAERLLLGHRLRAQEGRVAVTVKVATSLDGRIALADGTSQWITGAAARRRGHLLRAEVDGIAVGAGTVRADDPQLNCRVAGLECLPSVRVVFGFSPDLRLGQSRLVQAARRDGARVFVMAPPEARAAIEQIGEPVQHLTVPWVVGLQGAAEPIPKHLDLSIGFKMLASEGLCRILVEGGAGLLGSLFRGGLVDECFWFRAPTILGSDARPVASELCLTRLAASPAFVHLASHGIGQDRLDHYLAVRRGDALLG